MTPPLPDEHQTPTPSPTSPGPSLFLPPTPSRSNTTTDPLPSSPSPGPSSSGPDVDVDWPDPAPESSSGTPSTDSRPAKRGAKLRALRKTMQAAVGTAGGVVHTFLTRPDSAERHAGVWVPDEDDVENIAEPLASLASRRAPAAVDNPDVTDLLALAAAVAGYVLKSLTARAQLAPEHYEQVGADGQPAGDLVDLDQPAAPASSDAGDTVTYGRGFLGRRAGLPDVDQVADGLPGQGLE